MCDLIHCENARKFIARLIHVEAHTLLLSPLEAGTMTHTAWNRVDVVCHDIHQIIREGEPSLEYVRWYFVTHE